MQILHIDNSFYSPFISSVTETKSVIATTFFSYRNWKCHCNRRRVMHRRRSASALPSLLASPSGHVPLNYHDHSFAISYKSAGATITSQSSCIEATSPPTDGISWWTASLHTDRKKGGRSTGLTTPHLLPSPPIILDDSATVTMSSTHPPRPFITAVLKTVIFRQK
jgi:hypothetical protein